jgi:hypothetical protein
MLYLNEYPILRFNIRSQVDDLESEIDDLKSQMIHKTEIKYNTGEHRLGKKQGKKLLKNSLRKNLHNYF